MMTERLIDLERLDAYRILLAQQPEKPLRGRLKHRITQTAKPNKMLIQELKDKFIRHLMYCQLEQKGDLE